MALAVSVLFNLILSLLLLDSDSVTRVSESEMDDIIYATQNFGIHSIRSQDIIINNDELIMVQSTDGLSIGAILGGSWREKIWYSYKRQSTDRDDHRKTIGPNEGEGGNSINTQQFDSEREPASRAP